MSTQTRAAIIAAAVILIAYLVGLYWLYTQRGVQDPAWTRTLHVVGGIEALAFAGAGWLWGTQVQRGAVDVAQNQLNETKQELKDTRTAKDDVVETAAKAQQTERERAATLALKHFGQRPSAGEDPDAASPASGGRRRVAPEPDPLQRYMAELLGPSQG